MLTAEQRAGLDLYLNNAERIGVGTGEWVRGQPSVNWCAPRGVLEFCGTIGYNVGGYMVTPKDATQEHYDAACGRLGRWLRFECGRAVSKTDAKGWISYGIWRGMLNDDKQISLNCPDDELTAMTYAALAVKGEKL